MDDLPCFRIKLRIHPDIVEDDTNFKKCNEGLAEGLGESQKKIRLMTDNSFVTIKEMSKIIGISTTAIGKNINTLKNKGIVERIGSDSNGRWRVNLQFRI